VKLPHLIHRDPHWQIRGLFAYYQCSCGRRRVRWVYRNLYGPVDPGWPPLRDEHGLELVDSGWRLTFPGVREV